MNLRESIQADIEDTLAAINETERILKERYSPSQAFTLESYRSYLQRLQADLRKAEAAETPVSPISSVGNPIPLPVEGHART
jgi:hypothetical protein